MHCPTGHFTNGSDAMRREARLGKKLGQGTGLRENGMSGGTDAERQDARMVTSSREELETQNVRSRK